MDIRSSACRHALSISSGFRRGLCSQKYKEDWGVHIVYIYIYIYSIYGVYIYIEYIWFIYIYTHIVGFYMEMGFGLPP